MMDVKPRVAVVTGASSGIGKEVAGVLVGYGWRVIGTGRRWDRMTVAAEEIERRARNGGSITMIKADLSSMEQVSQLADEVATLTDRVNLLINNAGGMTDRLVMTPEGLEANFAGNHLGPFLLTNKLLPLLVVAAKDAPAGATRILMTASDASEMIPGIDMDDIQHLGRFSPGIAYCAGKLGNVLFTRGLARRLAGSGIVVHAVAPGATETSFYDSAPRDTREQTRHLAKLSVEQGASTLIWLALEETAGGSSGGYWENCAPRRPNAQADDPDAVERFWVESEKLIAAAIAKIFS